MMTSTIPIKSEIPINSESVFLVTGGAKGITAQCVIKLAQKYQCRWILLGRSEIHKDEFSWVQDSWQGVELKRRIMEHFQAQDEKPTPPKIERLFKQILSHREIQQTLSTLEQLGCQVSYLSVDVTDLAALKSQLIPLVERMGAITGIIHGAGNLADKWIEKKTEQDFELVYSAKVKGLENLLHCVEISQLDYLVLFSSVAGFFGNVGQSDYALANEILNKSAHLVKQYYPNCHVVAINWGPWESGMVTPTLKQLYARRNIEVIPIDVGTKLLIEELKKVHHDVAQVVIGSPLTPPTDSLDSKLNTYQIRRRLSLFANPFLQDHIINNYPVLPATCAAGWLIKMCEQLYPGYQFFSLENLQVLKGVVFDNTQADEFIADLTEVSKVNHPDFSEVVIESKIWSETEKRKPRFHYRGKIQLRSKISVIFMGNQLPKISDKVIDNLSVYQQKILFHGPSFQGIQSILELADNRLTMRCKLPTIKTENQGYFEATSFNPYTADVILQSALVWASCCHQITCLPMEIQQIKQYKTIDFDEEFYVLMEIKSHFKKQIVVDILVCNLQGELWAKISGAKYLALLNNF